MDWPPDTSALLKVHFLMAQPKHVMGTQKNRLNETVLLSTQNNVKLMDKKIFTVLCPKILFTWTHVHILICLNMI